MSVFKSLGDEHALILSLLGRLERAIADPDERSAVRETRNSLLVLVKALEAHDHLERLVFDPEPGVPAGAGGAPWASVERQHVALSALREEALSLLQELPREDPATVRGLSRRLARLLRRHFEDEERSLWPSFNATAGRSRLHLLDREARAQVKTMKKEFDAYLSAFEDNPA